MIATPRRLNNNCTRELIAYSKTIIWSGRLRRAACNPHTHITSDLASLIMKWMYGERCLRNFQWPFQETQKLRVWRIFIMMPPPPPTHRSHDIKRSLREKFLCIYIARVRERDYIRTHFFAHLATHTYTHITLTATLLHHTTNFQVNLALQKKKVSLCDARDISTRSCCVLSSSEFPFFLFVWCIKKKHD